jgi:hypothetical protein
MFVVLNENNIIIMTANRSISYGDNTVVEINDSYDTPDIVGARFTTDYLELPPSSNHVFENGKWVDVRTNEEIIDEIRATRNELLRNSDWVFFEDSPVNDDMKNEVKGWRRELREFFQNHNENLEDEFEMLKNKDPLKNG